MNCGDLLGREGVANDLLCNVDHPLECFPQSHCIVTVPHRVCWDALNRTAIETHQQSLVNVIFLEFYQEVQPLLGLLYQLRGVVK